MKKLSVIKAMIVSRDINISQAASGSGLNQSYISQVIQYKKNISKNTLLKLLDYLGYTYEQYLYLENYRIGLEKNEMEYQQKWGVLLMQTTMFFIWNCSINEEKSFQKSLGEK